MREMETRCTAHNKLVTCDNPVVHKNISKAVSEAYGPAYVSGSDSTAVASTSQLGDQITGETEESAGKELADQTTGKTMESAGDGNTSVSSVNVNDSNDLVVTKEIADHTTGKTNECQVGLMPPVEADENKSVSSVDVEEVTTNLEDKGTKETDGFFKKNSLSNTFVPGTPAEEAKENETTTETGLETPFQIEEDTQARLETSVGPVTASKPNPTSSTMPKPTIAMSLPELQKQMKLLKSFEREFKKEKRAESQREQRVVQELKKKLAEAKEDAKNVKIEKAKEALAVSVADDADDTDDFLQDIGRKQVRKKATRLDAWQLGNRYARQEKHKWLNLTTVNSMAEVMSRLRKYGFCIVNNFAFLLQEKWRPDAEQRDYILTVPQDNTVDLFEGAQFTDTLGYTTLVWPSDTRLNVRVQLKSGGHSGKWGAVYSNYKKKYKNQLDDIIRGMFRNEEPSGDPDNWKMDFNSIMGGQGYQHPHSDHGRAGTYKHLKLFPFVGLHGFGLDPFSLWLLPPNSEYGFLHTFEPHQIVFLRGDQTHAGIPSPVPRGHMEFFPLPQAGYERQHPYWTRSGYKQETYPYQESSSCPFGYPDVTPPTPKGVQHVRYPVEVTHLLQLPLNKGGSNQVEKLARIAMKKKMAGQQHLW
jgi:hypothetical protein